MRKFVVLFLALALLLPFATTAKAEETTAMTSFAEDFDSYPDGQISDYKMKDPDAWGYGIAGGTSDIRNKALVLTGTATYQNKDVPAKITAAEAYAKEQTWEITVTVPEGLDAKAEIIALRYEGKGGPVTNRGTAITDGGLRIREYTLYYTQLLDKDDPVNIRGEEKALCKLDPGTYTLKRVMNMAEPENFTQSISVLDQSGKEIAKIKNVECPYFTDITAIYFGTAKANTEVILDNYKISATGAAANLFLTDAADKALKAEDKHSGAVNYRLAWFNAAQEEKTFILMAAYYDGDKLIREEVVQELTLPAGEGAETGTVEAAQGEKVKLYLRDPAKEQAQRKQTILLIAGGAVALVAAVIAVIFLAKVAKKQNAKSKAKKAAKLEAFLNCEDE